MIEYGSGKGLMYQDQFWIRVGFVGLGSIMGWDRIMDQDRDNGSGSTMDWDRIRSVRNQYGSGSIIDSDGWIRMDWDRLWVGIDWFTQQSDGDRF